MLYFVADGLAGCGNDWISNTTAEVAGNNITATYSVTRGTNPICFSTPPPYGVIGSIGVLTPGTYVLTASGTVLAEVEPRIAITFTVPASPVGAIEYHRADVDHYFVTANTDEIAKLDSGVIVGWNRTGESFAAIPPSMSAPSSVCRFYGRPEAGLDSHFHSASPAECSAVEQRFSYAWIKESSNVFGVTLPDATSGACPDAMKPIHRLYNNRADVNHRYVGSPETRNTMIAAGWIAEGYGPNAVALCAF